MWDVFISHASEDKDYIARPLAKQFSEVYKAKVWYDEFTLEYGDSLLMSIEKGLQDSTYGVVIFSHDFFKKVWTNHEYTSLKTKEMLLNKKVIIPIWYNITKKEIAEYSLVLADKYAIQLNDNFDVDDLAVKILKIIRPDIYDSISRMRYFNYLMNNSKSFLVSDNDFSKASVPPIRHKRLSNQMKARLKLIHNAIKDVDNRNYETYEEDFRRSTNIDREIIITELLIAAYVDCISKRDMMVGEKAIIYLLALTLGNIKNDGYFSKDEWRMFNKIIKDYVKNIDAEIVMEYKFDA